MIFRSKFDPLPRINPLDSDMEDNRREDRNKKVWHLGRAWREAEENDLPLQPNLHQATPSSQTLLLWGVSSDKVLMERAHYFYEKLTTLEEKAAQLSFLVTEAIYDSAAQQGVEQMIQKCQIGGIVFHKGVYKRQAYLIERYQEVSKIPLLFGNDYLHGLSFYLQGDALPKITLSEQHYADIGKAVMAQNRRLGVQIQFDFERGAVKSPMSEKQAKAFRRGVRAAQGVVGREKGEVPTRFSPIFSAKHYQVQKTIGYKTLLFFDGVLLPQEVLEEKFIQAFKQQSDVFLLSGQLPEATRVIADLIRSGKMDEEALNRHVMQVLILKARFFKT